MSRGEIINRKVVAEAMARRFAPHGVPKYKPPHKEKPPTAIYRQTTIDGLSVMVPVNKPAQDHFDKLTLEEQVALITSAPSPVTPVTRSECESRRIQAGSRFKALPRGVREGDVFKGERVLPIHPASTGSLARIRAKGPRKPPAFVTADDKDPVSQIMRRYGVERDVAEQVWKQIS